jgi:hypothetical protein
MVRASLNTEELARAFQLVVMSVPAQLMEVKAQGLQHR